MKLVMDGRLLAAKPSGVRDIALGMADGFRELALAGTIDFNLAGDIQDKQHAMDSLITEKPFMHLGLPRLASKIRADRIFVPRQTRPILSTTESIPLFHDIGFFRAPALYPKKSSIRLTSRLAALSHRALAVSAFTANEMRMSGISDRVAPLPIQAVHRLSWRPSSGRRYLLCIAVQEPHKNLIRLVKAWSEAETNGFDLVICGRPGMDSSNIAEAVNQSPKADSILIRSSLSDDAYLALLEGCWGYIQPSLYEGLCIPALDLAAAGVPSAVSTSGNLGEVYNKAPAGQVFDAFAITEMSSSINLLLHDVPFRATASRWNADNVALTNWRRVAESAVEAMS